MPLHQLARAQWQAYLDRVSAALGAEQVQLEVTGMGLGAQVQADWIPLVGLSYDPKGDVLTVAAEGIEHLIHHPRQIHVDATWTGCTAWKRSTPKATITSSRCGTPCGCPQAE